MSNFDIKSPLPTREIVMEKPAETKDEPSAETTTVGRGKLPLAKKIELKKYWPIVAIVGIIVLIIFIVSKMLLPNIKSASKQTVTTLTYWGLWEDSSMIDGLINEYESKNPGIKINYKKSSKTDYRTRLQGRLVNQNTTEEVPDIFRIHATWLPMMKSYLASVPAQTLKDVQLETDFYTTFANDIKEEGKYWGIPLMYDGLTLFYNKTILDSAGVIPPKTWWGLRDLAKKLTVRDGSGKISIAGVAMGVTDNVDHWSDIIGVMMKQNGIDLFTVDATNTQKLNGVLTFYTLFKTTDRVWDEALPNSTRDFAEGKLAFYFAPSWRVFDIEAINPSLSFGIAPIPQLPTLDGVDPAKVESGEIQGNLTSIYWSTYWIEGVSNKSKNQKEAWKFLTFLASKEGLQKFYAAASNIRSFGEIYPRKSMAESLSDNSKLKAFTDTADKASTWYMASMTHDAGLNDEMIKYFGDAINGMVQNSSTAEMVIPGLQNGIARTIQKYQLTKK